MSETSYPGGAGTPQPGVGKYGSLLKRFGARILDGLIIGIPVAIVFAVLGFDTGTFLYGVVSSLLYFGYFVFLETTRGATFGKAVLGMRVAGEDGRSPVSTEASAIRNSWMLIGVLSGIPLVGFLAGLASLAAVITIAVTISSDPRNQGLHDRFGGTLVLDKP